MSELTPIGSRWLALRRAAFDRDEWRCRKCAKPGRLEAHHITPLRKGGDPFDLANVETLCRRCHIDLHRGTSPELAAAAAAWKDLVDELR